MEARDVSALHDTMRRYGIPGILTPDNPQNPAGPWRVFDHDGPGRRDITDTTLTAAEAVANRRPTRGFVIAP
ncbi:hypothetical protein [Streptomyces sp. NPDC004285]